MLPTFELFGKTITVYGLLALVGIFASGIFSMRVAKKRGIDDNNILFTLLIAGIGVLVGSHILYAITNIEDIPKIFAASDWNEFIHMVSDVFGGAVFYGGLIGGIIAGAVYMRIKHYDFGVYSDIIAPAVPLFHCFGRIGCFLTGCCYGVECEVGFTYHNSIVASANGVNRFPVQLVEAGFNLCLFFVLFALLRKKRLETHLFSLYLVCYPIARFILEFFRGDEYRGHLLGLSTSQFISIILILCAAIYEIKRWLKSRKERVTE